MNHSRGLSPLYALTAVFNPRRFKSRVRLYHDFARRIAASGVQLLTVEVAFGCRPHEVTDSTNPWHLQLRTDQDIWHKEDALNLGVAHLTKLVPDWEYFTYLDADINLTRPDWPAETVHLLQHYAILQMFGEVQCLGPDNHTYLKGISCCRAFAEHGEWKKPNQQNPTNSLLCPYPPPCPWGGWPGLGWAYRRPEYEAIGGLLDICVNSSGDTQMAACYMGDPGWGMSRWASEGFRRYIHAYGDLCDLHVKGNISYLPGLLVHYWHGKGKDRGHGSRARAIEQYAYDPYTDIMRDSQGLLKWRGNKPGLEYAIRRSLEARNEDSIDP